MEVPEVTNLPVGQLQEAVATAGLPAVLEAPAAIEVPEAVQEVREVTEVPVVVPAEVLEVQEARVDLAVHPDHLAEATEDNTKSR